MRTNRYSQIPQVMTGQLISPARPVFAVAAGVSRGSGLEGSIGSNSMVSGSRSISTPTMFHFTPKSGSKRQSKAPIQFIH
jgi:hypothetical protein